jgi:hypothetical protein
MAEGVAVIEVTDPAPHLPSLLFTGGLLGYTEPCGCTTDLVLGGIDRVTGFVRTAAGLASGALVLDAGNWLFEHATVDPREEAQARRRVQVLVQAMRAMGTQATVPGPMDFALGLDFYRETVADAGLPVLAANASAGAEGPLGLPSLVLPAGDLQVGVLGGLDPGAFAGHPVVQVTDPAASLQPEIDRLRQEAGAGVVVLLWQGSLTAARQHLSGLQGLDFIVVGYQPRRTDEAVQVGDAWVLEPYDQGRVVGRLKLQPGPPADDGPGWVSARQGSTEARERLQRVIEGIEERLAEIEVPPGEDPPAIVVRQRERLTDLQAELAALSGETSWPADHAAFLWEPVDMAPGYRTDDGMTAAMVAYNAALREINQPDDPIPASPGMPVYVGSERCATCHVQAHETWQGTAHSHAIETLRIRDKDWDRSCIGCHVTGWQQPGGSVLGHTAGLENVQCEQCHGPGSLHVDNPTVMRNVEGGVWREVTEGTCVSCHNEEHSPRFEFHAYVERVLGPGHQRRAAGPP